MATLNLASFRAVDDGDPTYYLRRDWEGGPHTVETRPYNKGWRCRPSKKGSMVLMVGRPGVEGCASIIQMSDGSLDVAVYSDRAPAWLADWLAAPRDAREGYDATYHRVAAASGWGLRVIHLIEQEVELLRKHA